MRDIGSSDSFHDERSESPVRLSTRLSPSCWLAWAYLTSFVLTDCGDFGDKFL